MRGLRPVKPHCRRRHCRLCHAPLRCLTRSLGQRLRQRDFGTPARFLRLGDRFGQCRPFTHRRLDRRIKRFGFRCQPGQRLACVTREITFAGMVRRQLLTLRGDVGNPRLHGNPFGLDCRQPVPRIRRRVTRTLCRCARGGQHARRFVRKRCRHPLCFRCLKYRFVGGLGFGLCHFGGRRGIAPAGIDQPSLGHANFVGQLAIALR